MGLEHLSPALDSAERWDRRLNDDEKQCLAFARALLQRPQWLVLNCALEALDADSRERIRALLLSQLSGVFDLQAHKQRTAQQELANKFKRGMAVCLEARG